MPATPMPEPPAETVAPVATEPPPTPTTNPMARLTASQTVNVRRGRAPTIRRSAASRQDEAFDITGVNPAGNWLSVQLQRSARLGHRPTWSTSAAIRAPCKSRKTSRSRPPRRPRDRWPGRRPRHRHHHRNRRHRSSSSIRSHWLKALNAVTLIRSTYVNGFVRYRSNSPRNGVCVHIAFYGPRNTKCSGCDGAGDGNFSFAVWRPRARRDDGRNIRRAVPV